MSSSMSQDQRTRVIALKFAGVCVDCGHTIEVGSKAHWEPGAKRVRCIVCPAPVADPFELLPVERIARGVAGRSARTEAARHRGPVKDAWSKGEEGEVTLGQMLDRKRLTDRDIEVLHDRAIPGSKANIDHIVVAASGVFVINAKKWSGKIEVKAPMIGKDRLLVGGRDRTKKVESVADEGKEVRLALDYDMPVRSALCFAEGQWASVWRTTWVNGVLVASPSGLLRRLSKRGQVAAGRRELVARQLADAFPEA